MFELCNSIRDLVVGVVSVFAFNCDDPSSNPTEVFIFFCKLFEKNENTQERDRGWAH